MFVSKELRKGQMGADGLPQIICALWLPNFSCAATIGDHETALLEGHQDQDSKTLSLLIKDIICLHSRCRQ